MLSSTTARNRGFFMSGEQRSTTEVIYRALKGNIPKELAHFFVPKSGQKTQHFEPKNAKIEVESTLVSIDEYRAKTGDKSSTDQQITERLVYLESLCRHLIKQELGLSKT